MSKFDEVFGKSKQPESYMFTEVGGSFGCQGCPEYVYEAKWYQSERLLVWECSQGHKSYIENFG